MNRQTSLKLDKTKDETYWISCAQCATETTHQVIISAEAEDQKDRNYSGEDDDDWFVYWDRYEIIQCQGCKLLTVRWESKYTDGWPGSDDCHIQNRLKFFPARIPERRPLPDRHLIPRKVANIYRETYRALCYEQPILAGIGIRALIETVCKDREVKGNLAKKIDKLVTEGFLTKQGAGFLHQLRQMGNRAAHDVEPHSNEELLIALDVVDNLLTNVYVIPTKMNRLNGF